MYQFHCALWGASLVTKLFPVAPSRGHEEHLRDPPVPTRLGPIPVPVLLTRRSAAAEVALVPRVSAGTGGSPTTRRHPPSTNTSGSNVDTSTRRRGGRRGGGGGRISSKSTRRARKSEAANITTPSTRDERTPRPACSRRKRKQSVLTVTPTIVASRPLRRLLLRGRRSLWRNWRVLLRLPGTRPSQRTHRMTCTPLL